MGQVQSTKYDSPDAAARKLSRNSSTIVAFLSPSCGLCRYLEPTIQQVLRLIASDKIYFWNIFKPTLLMRKKLLQAEAAGIPIIRISTADSLTWAPELLAYDVETVPCLVLLNEQGMCDEQLLKPLPRHPPAPSKPHPNPNVYRQSPLQNTPACI